jgi:hypothetical protein
MTPPEDCSFLMEKVDQSAKEFIQTELQTEIDRLAKMSVKALALPVQSFGVFLEQNHELSIQVNRIHVISSFDFQSRIKQIMVSEPIKYPHKPDFLYVHVLLMTERIELPIILPYIFPGKLNAKGNNLKEWLIVNSKGLNSRLSINEYQKIYQLLFCNPWSIPTNSFSTNRDFSKSNPLMDRKI